MWRVMLIYKLKCICNHSFMGYINRFNVYLLLIQAYKLISKSTLSFFVNANNNINIEYQIFIQAFSNIFLLYSSFYPNYPTQYYLQYNDYPILTKQLIISVPAFSLLDNWNKYNMIYRYTAIYEHKVAKALSDNFRDQRFNLCIIEVFYSNRFYYLDFLQLPLNFDLRFATDNLLHVSFNLKHNFQAKK